MAKTKYRYAIEVKYLDADGNKKVAGVMVQEVVPETVVEPVAE